MTAFPAGDLAPAPTGARPAIAQPAIATRPELPVAVRQRRRWHRAVIPFVVLALFWAWTLLAHSLQEPDLGDPGTMSPTGTGADGSSILAARLRAQGITVVPVGSTAQAVTMASNFTAATVFVPAPDLLDGSLVLKLTSLSRTPRVVLVRPGLFAQAASGAPFIDTGTRWASKPVAPGCTAPVAVAAGAATAHHDSYTRFDDLSPFATVTMDCYQGGLVAARVRGFEIVYVGATDPFRNSRIGERGNAALATGLFAGSDQVIWLDVHSKERVAAQIDLSLPRYHRGDRNRSGTGNPTLDAFPPMLWAWLLLLAGGAVLIALVRGRRLGPPVAEPLPVVVPAAEAVTGRGRLYRRVRARQATLDALRASAIARIARVVYPFGQAPPERDLLTPGPAADALVTRIAARTSDPNTIRTVLYGLQIDSDEGLAAAVASLDALVAAVMRPNPSAPPPHTEETP